MTLQQQRAEIIKELQHVSEEWVLKAVARLLGIDAEVPDDHQQILSERVDAYQRGEARCIPMDEARKRFI